MVQMAGPSEETTDWSHPILPHLAKLLKSKNEYLLFPHSEDLWKAMCQRPPRGRRTNDYETGERYLLSD